MKFLSSQLGNMGLVKERYDYFLIWGNGFKYKEEIIAIIRSNPSIEILKIMNYKPKSIRKLVKAVYSYDYAPFSHLKSKTKYLMSTDPNVVFIFVRNKNVQEVYRGEGLFRHIECKLIQSIKEEIRYKFNERKNGRRTENHVIHASDNESQVNHILKYLGFRDGVGLFNNVPNPILSVPYHINKFNKFVITKVNFSQVYCNILIGSKTAFSKRKCKIEETPHFACLTGNTTPYEEYLSTFEGSELTDDYSLEKLLTLSQNFVYLQEPYSTSYILTKEFRPGLYLILDGVHRASILKYRGIESFIVAVVE